jgi:streptogramin lyase
VSADASGKYAIDAMIGGEYILSARDAESRRSLLTGKIKLENSLTRIDTVRMPGALRIILPDMADVENGYVFIQGTSIVQYLKNNVFLDNGKKTTILDKVPSVFIEGIYYGYSSESSIPCIKIANLIQVVAGDTTVTIPVVFQRLGVNVPSQSVSSIARDRDNKLWVGSDDGRTFVRTDTGWKDITPTEFSQWNSEPIRSISTDVFGDIWISKDKDGLFKYTKHHWVNYNTLLMDTIFLDARSTVLDRGSRIWVGDQKAGVVCYIPEEDENHSRYYRGKVFNTINSGLPGNNINSLFIAQDGSLWFATTNGVAHLAEGIWEVFTTENSSLPDNEIFAFAQDYSGSVWVATGEGVAYYNGVAWGQYTNATTNIPQGPVSTIAIDSNSIVWCAFASGGVSCFNGKKWTIYTPENSNLPSNGTIVGIVIDRNGIVWLISKGGSVVSYIPKIITKNK